MKTVAALYGVEKFFDDKWRLCEADESDYYEKAFATLEAAQAYAAKMESDWRGDAARYGWAHDHDAPIHRAAPLPADMVAHDIVA